jgi:hypothetical protein
MLTAQNGKWSGEDVRTGSKKSPSGPRICAAARTTSAAPASTVTVTAATPRRPANAAHHLTLNPGDVATADVTAYAIDTATGDACPRWGNLVVTPPNGFVSHPMSVDVPICSASISSVN